MKLKINYMFRGNRQNGRTPGAPNRSTVKVKECFNLLLEANLELLQADLLKLSSKDRVTAILQIATFILPKMRSVDLEVTENEKYKPIIVNLQEWK